MIISVFNTQDSQPEKYSFTDAVVYLGRNPSAHSSVTIDSQTVSRNHLKAQVADGAIQIMDLTSSNGTFLSGSKIEPNRWLTITSEDKIQIAEFEGYVTFAVRQASIRPPSTTHPSATTKRQEEGQSQDSGEERSRSREKQVKKRELPFKISQSTLKMLKDMTVNKKSKDERVKFLKLMGIGKAEEYWLEIQSFLKQKKSVRDSRKTNEELEKQFSAARNALEKRGLGK